MDDKKIYMELDKNQNLKKELKSQAKEQPLEFVIDELKENISIEIIDGIANITMPEPTLQMLTTALKQLDINLFEIDKGIGR